MALYNRGPLARVLPTFPSVSHFPNKHAYTLMSRKTHFDLHMGPIIRPPTTIANFITK